MTHDRDATPALRSRATTIRASRMIRRIALPALLVLGVFFYLSYGAVEVPGWMDTMPQEYPAGTICVIRKNPSSVPVGSVVFVEIDGGVLLSRVSRVSDDGFFIEHDNAESRFTDGEELGLLPFDCVTGLVLTGFVPDGSGGERGR